MKHQKARRRAAKPVAPTVSPPNPSPMVASIGYTTVETTLAARALHHGNFMHVAVTAQDLKDVLHDANFSALGEGQREALEMICSKIARICNGDGNFPDHWHDIAGYATLVERDLRATSP